MIRKRLSATVILLFSAVILGKTQPANAALTADFDKVLGNWYGQLTYLDYTSGKAVQMAANAEVQRLKKPNQFVLFNRFSDEPRANSGDTLRITNDGKTINDETVVSRTKLSSGLVSVVTTSKGIDGNDNRAASFRHTYILDDSVFVRKKEVQFVGEAQWITRYEFTYGRQPAK